jgi:methyl-accepting chemotaxis protein WspA
MKNVPIVIRLILTFVLISCLLLTISLISLNELNASQKAIQGLQQKNLVPLRLLRKVTDLYYIRVRPAVTAALRNEISPKDAATQIESAVRIAQQSWNDYKQRTGAPENHVLNAETKLTAANEYVVQMATALKDNDLQTLDKLYNQSSGTFDKAVSDTARLADWHTDEGEKFETDLSNRFDRQRIFVVTATVVAVLIGIGACVGITQAVREPLKRLLQVINRMREGDFTVRTGINSGNEFGILGSGFDRMSDNLATLIAQIQRTGLQVNDSTTQIAAGTKQQVTSANETAATTTEIGATAKEISATSNELVKTVNEVTRLAEETAAMATQGQTDLARIEATIEEMLRASATVAEKLNVLNEKAGNIHVVISTITKVADQTNLLSLNAAIEAEKAGEYGAGFSVVAREIRRLADQTAAASYDIEQTVKEILSAVSTGVMGMDKFSEDIRRGVTEIKSANQQLNQIIQHVQLLSPRIETVNEGMQLQATGANQISDALIQLNTASQQTADSVRQADAAMERLHEVTRSLQQSVSRFRINSDAVPDLLPQQ